MGDVFDHDIFLSHAGKDASRADEVRAALIQAGFRVYCDRYDDPQLDRTHVNRTTADVLRRRMRGCKMLLFVVTAQSAQSKWMPWELGFFDAARGHIVVYPVDKAAERAARGQEYLSLYDVVAPGSIESEIRSRLEAAEQPYRGLQEGLLELPHIEALAKLQGNVRENIFGPGDAGATVEYGNRIRRMATPFDVNQALQLQSDIAAAWWRLWLGMIGGR